MNFAEKNELKIKLLSDPEKTVHKLYGAWGIKKMYGKEIEGTIRSTFVIDPEGILRYSWKNVKVKGHVDTVYKKLKDLIK